VTGMVHADGDFTFSATGLTVAFTDTSTDAGGTIGSHAWTFGDGGTSTAANPSHTYSAGGTYSVTETVTDSGNGSTSSKTSSVSVSASGGTPVANFTYTINGLTVSFRYVHRHAGGSIGTHNWNSVMEVPRPQQVPATPMPAPATYSVSETVTDSVNNSSSTKTVAITVTASTSTQLIVNRLRIRTSTPWTLTPAVLCSNSTCGWRDRA